MNCQCNFQIENGVTRAWMEWNGADDGFDCDCDSIRFQKQFQKS
jgi:hypothetical protein